MRIYSADIRSVSTAEYEYALSLVSDTRREYIARLRSECDKKLTVMSELLARRGIAELTGVPEREITLLRSDTGKPYAAGLDIHFNVSHSGDFAVCAVNDAPVGIDIERVRDIPPRLIERTCTDREREYVNGSAERFFEVWTAKEAYAKCTGEGLTSLKADISKGSFQKINIADGYICTVCTILRRTP